MKKYVGYGLLALLAYGIFMIIQLPATLLVDLAARHLSGFAVQDVQGSIIQGSARHIQLEKAQFGSMTWQLRFLPLLSGRLEYRFTAVEAPDTRLQGIAGMGLDRRLRINRLDGRLPLPKAIALAGRPPPPLNGELQLDITGLQLDKEGHPQAAYGTARLINAYTSFGRALELGDFSAELDTQDSTIIGNIQDNGGPLEFTGILTLASDGRYRFSGKAAARDHHSELRQALNLLGQPGSDGKWTLNFSSTL